jgi:hypothetical protein
VKPKTTKQAPPKLRAVPKTGDEFRKAVADLFEAPDAIDAVLLRQCAELLDRVEQARAEIAAHGLVYLTRSGMLRRNPAVEPSGTACARCWLSSAP